MDVQSAVERLSAGTRVVPFQGFIRGDVATLEPVSAVSA